MLGASRTVAALAVPEEQGVRFPAATQRRRACGDCWRCADRPDRACLRPVRSGPDLGRRSPDETSPPNLPRRNGPTRRENPPLHVADRRARAAGLQPLLGEEEIASTGETGDPLRRRRRTARWLPQSPAAPQALARGKARGRRSGASTMWPENRTVLTCRGRSL